MRICLFLVILAGVAQSQVQLFPFLEQFDSTSVPALPSGWTTTTNRSPSGDFMTTISLPYSDPNAMISTNATIPQSLTSPILNFSNKEADSLKFYERRSSSHNSALIVEASTDGGENFSVQISDSIKNPGVTSYVLRSLSLPSSLSNQAAVKIRWRIVGNGSGTTGTLRLDDVRITARSAVDVSVDAINFSPPFPNAGDSVDVLALVRNAGTQPIQNISVNFYDDLSGDTLPQPDELFSSSTIGEILQPNDSATVRAQLLHLSSIQQTIIVGASVPGDQNPVNNLKRAGLTVGTSRQTVVINEIMYAPSTGEPEWVELFNTGASPVDLKNWKISNRNSSTRYLLSSLSDLFLPNSYIVVTKDSALFQSFHPAAISILQSTTLPTFLFNNSGDAVVLFDLRGAIMDSVRYTPTWGGSGGKSLERIESDGASNDQANWATSGDSSGSTPGRENYLTPLEHDLRVVGISSQNFSLTSARISVTIRNTGRQPETSFSVSLFNDINRDSISQSSELLETLPFTSFLSPKDSVTLTFTWNNPGAGKQFLIASIDFATDMRPSDNSYFDSIKISFPQKSLIINEIMYDPKPGGAEYVELLNRGSDPVDVYQWRLSDVRDTSTRSGVHVISHTPFVIRGGEYMVIASDSSIFGNFHYLADSPYHVLVKRSGFSLNNSGDDVLLTDLTGETIDSVHYLPAWHNGAIDDASGRSLERINPYLGSNDARNWSTSADPLGGTPGKLNSIYTIAIPNSASISFSPNPFSPDGDGFEDVTVLSYRLPLTATVLRVRIFDAKGRLIRTLADGEPGGGTGEIIWDGFTDKKEKANIGIYIALLEATNGEVGSGRTVKGVVVVAAKM